MFTVPITNRESTPSSTPYSTLAPLTHTPIHSKWQQTEHLPLLTTTSQNIPFQFIYSSPTPPSDTLLAAQTPPNIVVCGSLNPVPGGPDFKLPPFILSLVGAQGLPQDSPIRLNGPGWSTSLTHRKFYTLRKFNFKLSVPTISTTPKSKDEHAALWIGRFAITSFNDQGPSGEVRCFSTPIVPGFVNKFIFSACDQNADPITGQFSGGISFTYTNLNFR